MVIMVRYSEATLILTGEEEAERIEGVEVFKYLGRILDRSDENYPAVLRNIIKSRQAWGRLGKLLQREGAYLAVLAKIYRAVVQLVLLFGEDTWVVLAPMMKRLEVAHLSFLWHVTQKRKQNVSRGWRCSNTLGGFWTSQTKTIQPSCTTFYA